MKMQAYQNVTRLLQEIGEQLKGTHDNQMSLAESNVHRSLE